MFEETEDSDCNREEIQEDEENVQIHSRDGRTRGYTGDDEYSSSEEEAGNSGNSIDSGKWIQRKLQRWCCIPLFVLCPHRLVRKARGWWRRCFDQCLCIRWVFRVCCPSWVLRDVRWTSMHQLLYCIILISILSLAYGYIILINDVIAHSYEVREARGIGAHHGSPFIIKETQNFYM